MFPDLRRNQKLGGYRVVVFFPEKIKNNNDNKINKHSLATLIQYLFLLLFLLLWLCFQMNTKYSKCNICMSDHPHKLLNVALRIWCRSDRNRTFPNSWMTYKIIGPQACENTIHFLLEHTSDEVIILKLALKALLSLNYATGHRRPLELW